MGLFDKKSTTKTSTTENIQTVTDNRAGGDGSIFGSNVTFGNNVSGVEVVTTDFGAVSKAFDAFDSMLEASDSGSKRTLEAITKNTDNTVTALKEFATQLTVGDIESAKYISYAIIAAVLIALVVYFWVS